MREIVELFNPAINGGNNTAILIAFGTKVETIGLGTIHSQSTGIIERKDGTLIELEFHEFRIIPESEFK